MTRERGFSTHVWKIMMVLSIIFIIWTFFAISRGSGILPTAFRLAGSSQSTDDIEKSALKFMDMTMLKPLWEEIWIGIFGLFLAFGLRNNRKWAWTMGIFWGIMMISNAAIQGGYEVLALGWSKPCLQTYTFLFVGIIASTSLLVARKRFS